MELNEYRQEFLDQVKARASAGSNFTHAEFVDICGERLSEAEELADFEVCHFRGIGSRNRSLGVDGFACDEVDGSIRLLIAEYGGQSDAATLTQTQAKALFSKLIGFCEESFTGKLQDAIEESSPAYSLAQMLYEQRKTLVRLRLYLVTDGALSSRVRDWPEGEIESIPTESHIWDINRFRTIQESKSGRDELEVDFTAVVPDGLPCLSASVPSDEYSAYLCIIPGAVLAEVYDRFGSRLLEGNVRSFLGTRGRINRAISKTISTEPAMFFAYNNGIAATASAATVESGTSGMRLTHVTDLQIVNGGQTTATLAGALKAREDGLNRTFVQMKLSILPPETAGKYIPAIARYANSQNKVSDADFFSNHDFHRRMEQIAQRLRAPAVGGAQYGTHWFYERARGQYVNEQAGLSIAQKKQFLLLNPKDQVITKTDLAKYENVWRFLPHSVSNGAQHNFMWFSSYAQSEWERDQNQFNEEYYRRVAVKAMLYKRTEALVSKQAWYEGSYRANIVAYTIAKLSHLLQFEGGGKNLDFKKIWNRQALPPAMDEQIVLTAEQVFLCISSPESGLQNILKWVKKDICWNRVRDARVPFLKDLVTELVSNDEEESIKKEAKVQQAVVSGIQMQTTVIELGSPFWRDIQEWGRQRNLVTPVDDSFFAVATAMPRKLPTEKQCARLLQIKARLEEEGFPIR